MITFTKLMAVALMVIGATTFVSAQTQTEYEEVKEKIKRYESMSLVHEDGYKSHGRNALEKIIIRRGDSTRYKMLWDTERTKIRQVYFVGVGEATPEDMRRGRFEVTLKPDKTTTYKYCQKYEIDNGKIVGDEYSFTVVVLDAVQYDSVMQLRSTMTSRQRSINYDELRGKKVDPFEKEMVDKMAKMTPKEQDAYIKQLKRKYGNKRR